MGPGRTVNCYHGFWRTGSDNHRSPSRTSNVTPEQPSRRAQASQPPRDTDGLLADVQRHALLALCDAKARHGVVACAVLGITVFTPLALISRSGWQLAALLALVLGSVIRWVTCWYLEQQIKQAATPTLWPLIIGATALTSLSWALAASVTLLQPMADHGGAIAMAATMLVSVASLWTLAPHRFVSRAFIAPMAVLPIAALMTPGTMGLGLAGFIVVGLAAAVMLTPWAEQTFAQRTALELRYRTMGLAWQKLKQEHAAVTAHASAIEDDRGLLFEHAGVGLAAVSDRKIERINAHLARQLKQTPQAFVGKDVLHLLARESQDAVDAVAKSTDIERTPIKAQLNLGAQVDGGKVEVVTPAPGKGSRLWVFKDVVEGLDVAPTDDTHDPKASSVLAQHQLPSALAGFAARAQDVTALVIALHGWHDLADEIGIAKATPLLDATVQRLLEACRQGDRVVQLEGASFVLLVAAKLSHSQLNELRGRIRTSLEAAHLIDDPDSRDERSVHFNARVMPLPCQTREQPSIKTMALVQEALVQARRVGGGASFQTDVDLEAQANAKRAPAREEAAIKPLKSTKPAPKVAAPVAMELITLGAFKEDAEAPAEDASRAL
jgi:GGDEF domain-containing protein